jgi:hypothetical protein
LKGKNYIPKVVVKRVRGSNNEKRRSNRCEHDELEKVSVIFGANTLSYPSAKKMAAIK